MTGKAEDSVAFLKEEFGRELRRLREAANLTQKALARRASYHRVSITQVEQGRQDFSRQFVDQIETALDAGGHLLAIYEQIAAARHHQRLQPADHLRRIEGPQPVCPLSRFVPTVEPDMIERLNELDVLVQLVVEAGQARPAAPVAIHAPGGFGKTTLAAQLCHDLRIAGEFDSFLWVETGQDCTDARVVQLIADLCVHLGHSRPALVDPDQAGFHLAQLIGDRRAVLVVDNVWSARDLSPFLMGGPSCVRLVTTRNVRVCPSHTEVFHLGGMSPQQIGQILHRSIREAHEPGVAELVDLCGGWPLLARVVGASLEQELDAGASPHRLLDDARKELLINGPGAFDVQDASRRAGAIGQVVLSSLRSLEEHVSVGPHGPLREKYFDLGIFPAAIPIPIDTLIVWWGHSHGWSASSVRQFCKILADRSLVNSYRADRQVVVLHDVFRAYIRNALADDWQARHRSLIAAFSSSLEGDWSQLPAQHEYIWRYLSYHLVEATLEETLLRLLSNPGYLVAKVIRFGHESLVADRSALLSLQSIPEPGTSLHQIWQVAKALTDRVDLLHGLTKSSDIAATLLARLMRSGLETPVVGELRSMVEGSPSALCPVWAYTTGDMSESISVGHVGAVTDVAWGKSTALVSCGEDGTVRIWDTKLQGRGHCQVLYGHTGWVFAVTLSPDGALIASAGEDATVRLWDRSSGRPVAGLVGHSRRIRSLQFDSTGRFLVSGAEDGKVCVWDIERQELLRELRTSGTPIWSVSISSDDQMVAVAGEDEFVRLFDLKSGSLLAERAAHRDWVRSVFFSRQSPSPLLASGSGDHTVCLWGTGGRQLDPIRSTTTDASKVRAVRFTSQFNMLAADEDATLHLWNEAGLVSRRRMPEGVDWVRAIEVTADGSCVAAACEDGGVRVWRPHDDQLLDIGRGANAVWSTAFGDHGRVALLGRGDGSLEVRDATSGDLLHHLSAGRGRVWSLTSAGTIAAAACGDGAIRIWDLEHMSEVDCVTVPERRTWSVAMDPACNFLAGSMDSGVLRVWDLPSRRPVLADPRAHGGRIRSIAFTESGQSLVTGSGDGTVRVWDLESSQVQDEFSHPGGWVRSVAIDTRGRIAIGSGAGDIYLRDLERNAFIAQFVGHTGRVLMLAFVQDADQLVSAAADGTIRVWSLLDSSQMSEMRCDASLLCASYDPNRRMVLASSPLETFAVTVGEPTITG